MIGVTIALVDDTIELTAREKERIRKQAYYVANRERELAKRKAHYVANREKNLAYRKVYYAANRQKSLDYGKVYRKSHFDKMQDYLKTWNANNHEKTYAYGKAWRVANPEKARASVKLWYSVNREKMLVYNRARRIANPEDPVLVAARSRAYQVANPDKIRQKCRKRRARKFALTGHATPQQVQDRWLYYGGKCWMCGATATCTDHVKPLSKGGSDLAANLRPACTSCNSRKGSKWPYATAKAAFSRV